jgi:carboxyl-terminal processing protease
MKSPLGFCALLLVLLPASIVLAADITATPPKAPVRPANQAELTAFLEKVYQTMDENYYMPVDRGVFDAYVKEYTAERLQLLNNKTKQTENYIHLGAGLLVNKLKNPKDKLTVFIPPKKTKEFKDKAYAVTEDLGIEGKKTVQGFEITKVQRHSDAFAEGIRSGDIIQKVSGKDLTSMDEESIKKLLSAELKTKITLTVLFSKTKAIKDIILEIKEYFRETVERLPSPKPGFLVLKILHFNQKTADDFAAEMSEFGVPNIKNLILDLRGNEGGPPLAAREILGYFLPANDQLFAIVRKRKPPVMLTAPSKEVAYDGPIEILVSHGTGSAAEMFSGVMQAKKRAKLVGNTTAGATYLKGIYDFEDKSALFMITSLTFFFDRRVFPENGLTPDLLLNDNDDALTAAIGQS